MGYFTEKFIKNIQTMNTAINEKENEDEQKQATRFS